MDKTTTEGSARGMSILPITTIAFPIMRGGAVPLKIFSGTWTEESLAQLSESSTTAAAQKIEFNRGQRCGLCPA